MSNFRNRITPAQLSVASRVLAAAVGGYALAAAAAVVLGHVLPGSRAGAVLAATQLSFAIYAGAILWAFAARSGGKAWAGLLLPAAVLAALAGGLSYASGS